MEQEITNHPMWLLELENRKRKPRLAHEAGAGAPCMNCNSACPGLDLHYWRKICKNCKCGRDDHDVDDDEFPQFDLLFGPNLRKFKKKSICLQVSDKKQDNGETTFEWVPPDTTKELAMDYMKALPMEKLPITGSIGAVLRRQLLQKQLPRHDIDYKVCDELSEQEQKQFEKYLENIKKYVGQGKVMKMFGARPFDRSLMTPVNATDMQKCSPQHKSHVPSTGVQLRTPSSFAVKNSHARHLYDAQNKRDATAINNNKVPNVKEYNCTLDNISVSSNIARSQPIEQNLIGENFQRAHDTVSINKKDINDKIVNSSILTHLAEQEVVPAREKQTSGNYVSCGGDAFEEHGETLNDTTLCIAHPEDDNKTAFIAESLLANAFLPPSAVHSNDIIGSTLDEKDLMFIREKLIDQYNAAENPVAMHAVSKSFRPLDTNNISFPRNSGAKENDDLADISKYAEERAAIIAAARNPKKTAELSSSTFEEVRKTYKPRSQIAESTIVSGTDINERKHCGLLAQNSKTANNDPLVRDISEATMESIIDPSSKRTSTDPTSSISNLLMQVPDSQKPIDAKSNPLQFELSSSSLQPSVIHSEQLQNQAFPHIVGSLNEQRVQCMQFKDCLKDNFENLKLDPTKVHECEKCHEDIRIGDVIVIAEKAKNASWHPGCFVCSVCDELLVDLVYFYYKNKLYCGRDLAAFLGIPRCFACDELIFVREYTVAEGHNYHVKHFCCWDCDMPLAGQQYISENDRPLCLPCYKKSYAKTCAACNVVIAADQQGVAIKNLNFHASEVCFCCYSCKKNLLNGRMAIKRDKLFCSKECIAKFCN